MCRCLFLFILSPSMTGLTRVKNFLLITSEHVSVPVEIALEGDRHGWTKGKEEELGELSIWHRMPTAYFHTVGLLVDDLDCSAALLPSIFFFFPSLPPWLVNRDYSQRAEPGSQTGRLSMWLSDTLRKKKTLLFPFLLCFSFSSPPLYSLCFCVIYTEPFILLRSSFCGDIILSTGMHKASARHRNCFVLIVYKALIWLWHTEIHGSIGEMIPRDWADKFSFNYAVKGNWSLSVCLSAVKD